MSRGCVVGIYEDFQKASQAVQALERSDFPSEQISLATHNVPDQLTSTDELKYSDEAESSAAVAQGGEVSSVFYSAHRC